MKITRLIELLAALMARINVSTRRQGVAVTGRECRSPKDHDTPSDSLQPRNIHCGARFGCRPTILPHCLGLEAVEAASARLGFVRGGLSWL